MIYHTTIESDLCEIILVGDRDGLRYLHFNAGKSKRKLKIDPEWVEKRSFFNNTIDQIEQYFAGKRQVFNIKINPPGTPFQKKVWGAMLDIPYGETRSYQEIAIAIGNEKATRAVGMANNRNPIPLIIPCHRVIGSNGKLVGFGPGIEYKIALLKLEGLEFKS